MATIKSTFVNIAFIGSWAEVYALCGAVCYAELAARLPRSGGEVPLLVANLPPGSGVFGRGGSP